MEVETPKNWETKELVKTTTAYGNEVMIPKAYMSAWELERKCYTEAKKKGIDTSIGAMDSNHLSHMIPEKRNALMVFYEKYHN